jgi:hypothetical protein
VTLVSRETASRVINNELKNATLIEKGGYFDTVKNLNAIDPRIRPPEAIVHNTINDLKNLITRHVSSNKNCKIRYIFIQSTADSPLCTFVCVFDDEHPIGRKHERKHS